MKFNHESPLFLLALVAFSGMAASFVISSTPLPQLQQAPNSQLAQVSCATGDLTCGLVGWWKLNDGSGTTAADSSGSGNNGTLSGSTLPTWTAGEIGGALQFNSAGFVNVGHSSSLDLTSGFTLAFWIKYDSSSGYILAKRSGATNSYSVLVSSSGAVYVVNAKGSTVSTGMTLPPGVWTHVALVVDDTGLDFTPYLNGIAGSTRSLVTAYPSAASQDLLLGASGSGSNGSNMLNGTLDDVRIYNRILSASDVSSLYSAAAPTGSTSTSTSTASVTPSPVQPPPTPPVTTLYIRAGATGDGSGIDWTNALEQFPATWVRGDTYYVAAGSYAAPTIIAASSSQWIYVKSATEGDHGTDAGWNSAYAGQAILSGMLAIDSPYVDLTGQTGSDTSGYGIKILESACPSAGKAVYLGQNNSHIHLSHIEIQQCGEDQVTAQDGIYSSNTIPTSDLYIGYAYIHDLSRNGITLGNIDGSLIEHTRIERIHESNLSIHGQGIQLTAPPMDDVTIRFNQFVDISGTAAIALLGSNGLGYSNILIYGNLFSSTDKSRYVYSPSAIYGRPGTTQANVVAYNNTFYNIYNPETCMDGDATSGIENRNNIYEKSYFQFTQCNAVSTNNFYFEDTGGNLPQAEPGEIIGTSSSLINPPSDMREVAGAATIGAGYPLLSPFNIDLAGTVRPPGNGWDIGAYQYVAGMSGDSIAGSGSITPVPTASASGGSGGGAIFTGVGSAISGGGSAPIMAATNSNATPCVASPSAIPASALSLTIGTRGSSVTNLQTFLVIMGYLNREYITGYFGPLTKAALNSYVASHPSTCSSNNQAPSNNNQTSSNNQIPNFTRSLKLGMIGTDVKNLQIFLNQHGFTVSQSGPGSSGHETIYFGPATFRALIRFQNAYADQILAPYGLSRGTGFFGPSTMKEANSLI